MTHILLKALPYLPSIQNDLFDLELPVFILLTPSRSFNAALSPYLLMSPSFSSAAAASSHMMESDEASSLSSQPTNTAGKHYNILSPSPVTYRNTELILRASETKKFALRLDLSRVVPCPPTLLGPLLRSCNQIQALQLPDGGGAGSEASVFDEHLRLICNQIPTLQSLSIPNAKAITDEGISNLAGLNFLRDLTMTYVTSSISSEGICEILNKKLKYTLRKLNVAGCINFDRDCLKSLLVFSGHSSGTNKSKLTHLNVADCPKLFAYPNDYEDEHEGGIVRLNDIGGKFLERIFLEEFGETEGDEKSLLSTSDILGPVMMESLVYLDCSRLKITDYHFCQMATTRRINSKQQQQQLIDDNNNEEEIMKISPLRTLIANSSEILDTDLWMNHFLFLLNLTLSQPVTLHLRPRRANNNNNNRQQQPRNITLGPFVTTVFGNDDSCFVELKGLIFCDFLQSLSVWGNLYPDQSFEGLLEAISETENDDAAKISHQQHSSRLFNVKNSSLRTSLKNLSIVVTSTMTDKTLATLGNIQFPNLERLMISLSNVSSVNDGRVTSRGIQSLFSPRGNSNNANIINNTSHFSPNLKELILPVTGSAGGRRSYSSFSIADNSCLGAIATSVGHTLERLDFTGSGATSEGIALHVSKLTKLKYLKLDLTHQISSDECLEALLELRDLESLSLNACSWVSEHCMLSYVSQLPNLTSLEVERCEMFSDAAFAALKDCPKLISLVCSGNATLTNATLELLKRNLEGANGHFRSLCKLYMMHCFAFSTQLRADVAEMYLKKGILIDL